MTIPIFIIAAVATFVVVFAATVIVIIMPTLAVITVPIARAVGSSGIIVGVGGGGGVTIAISATIIFAALVGCVIGTVIASMCIVSMISNAAGLRTQTTHSDQMPLRHCLIVCGDCRLARWGMRGLGTGRKAGGAVAIAITALALIASARAILADLAGCLVGAVIASMWMASTISDAAGLPMQIAHGDWVLLHRRLVACTITSLPAAAAGLLGEARWAQVGWGCWGWGGRVAVGFRGVWVARLISRCCQEIVQP
jgi:hypothetical protein